MWRWASMETLIQAGPAPGQRKQVQPVPNTRICSARMAVLSLRCSGVSCTGTSSMTLAFPGDRRRCGCRVVLPRPGHGSRKSPSWAGGRSTPAAGDGSGPVQRQRHNGSSMKAGFGLQDETPGQDARRHPERNALRVCIGGFRQPHALQDVGGTWATRGSPGRAS